MDSSAKEKTARQRQCPPAGCLSDKINLTFINLIVLLLLIFNATFILINEINKKRYYFLYIFLVLGIITLIIILILNSYLKLELSLLIYLISLILVILPLSYLTRYSFKLIKLICKNK